MKTAIIVPVWKRPEVTKLCFENLAKTGLSVFIASDEQWVFEEVKKYGFTIISTPNDYLGRKKNELLKVTLLDCFEWDQVMEIGSDNLIDLSKLDEYLSLGLDHYGTSSIYFADPKNKRAKYYNAPRKIWGAGRVMSRKAVENSFPLWDDKGKIYLDSQANAKLESKGYKYSVVQEPICVDIKTEVNIHPYTRFGGVDVKYKDLSEKFPELKTLTKMEIK